MASEEVKTTSPRLQDRRGDGAQWHAELRDRNEAVIGAVGLATSRNGSTWPLRQGKLLKSTC